MIAYEQPEIIPVPTDSADYVEVIADHAGVGVHIINGEYVAKVSVPGLGVLRYTAPVPVAEQVA